MRSWMTGAFGAIVLVFLAQSVALQQGSATNAGGDWPMYRYDLAGTGYSPLASIDAANVGRLTRVWTYSLQSDAPPIQTS